MNAAFDLEAARRLPFAEGVLRLLDFALDEKLLENVFERYRGRSYEREISFATFVRLIADALLGHCGESAHQTFQQAKEDKVVDITVQALYGKLGRVPLDLSLGLFTEAAAQMGKVAAPVIANPLPATLSDFWTLGLDGKKIKYVAKHLKALRRLKGHIFGGKLLVVQDLATQQAVAAHAVADGEAADNPLVSGAVARVRALADPRAHLWVADRAFCDYALLQLLAANGDHFVIRFNTSCGFHADSACPARTGIDNEGRPYREEWGWLGDAKNPDRVRVRMITVTRAGDEPFIVITSLEDADRYPAADLLTLYRSRWEMETMFQKVVQTFDLRHLIGATPQATVFQAMLCLLLFNNTLLLRDFVAEAAQQPPKEISMQIFFGDVVAQLAAWLSVIGRDAGIELLHANPITEPDALRKHLQTLLSPLWKTRWRKQPTRKRPPRQPPRAYIVGGHTSVDKVLRSAHHEVPLKPTRKKTRKNNNAETPPWEKKKHL